MTARRSCGTSRTYDVSQLTTAQLERKKRELQVNLGLIGPHSPARVPVQAQMRAIDSELAERTRTASRTIRELNEDADMALPYDPANPNVARIYDYLLDGKDNYAADRAAARKILEIEPRSRLVARQNRDFLRRAVWFLTGEMGIRQFLDIGSGLPTAENVHQVAQSCAPDSRIVYADHDPVVLAHSRALLTSSPQGTCDYIDADLRDPASVITQAAETLDFTKPVAVLLIAILHFIPDKDDPWDIVSRLMAAVPSGSYLVVSHATPQSFTDAGNTGKLNAVYAETAAGGVTPRPLPEITAFFNELKLLTPGVVDISKWLLPAWPAWKSPQIASDSGSTLFYGGVAQKP